MQIKRLRIRECGVISPIHISIATSPPAHPETSTHQGQPFTLVNPQSKNSVRRPDLCPSFHFCHLDQGWVFVTFCVDLTRFSNWALSVSSLFSLHTMLSVLLPQWWLTTCNKRSTKAPFSFCPQPCSFQAPQTASRFLDSGRVQWGSCMTISFKSLRVAISCVACLPSECHLGRGSHLRPSLQNQQLLSHRTSLVMFLSIESNTMHGAV